MPIHPLQLTLSWLPRKSKRQPGCSPRAIGAAAGLTLASILSSILCGPAGAKEVNPVIGMYRIVQVERGDTLNKIARRYGVNAQVLSALNQVRDGRLKFGQELTLPLLHVISPRPERLLAVAIGQQEAQRDLHTSNVGGRS